MNVIPYFLYIVFINRIRKNLDIYAIINYCCVFIAAIMENILAVFSYWNIFIHLPFGKKKAIRKIKVTYIITIIKPKCFISQKLKSLIERMMNIRVCMAMELVSPNNYFFHCIKFI